MTWRILVVFAAWDLVVGQLRAAEVRAAGATLAKAVLSEAVEEQLKLLQELTEANDALVQRALTAWRQSELFVYESDSVRVPFLLETQADSEGKAKGIRLDTGEVLKGTNGQAMTFVVAELT